ncbi:MAS20-domain-containing protein [Dendrothele bispora CBS 962.96]|uniref:MAS20-domain-containing protein n=1 Tax=Dendrothele bispora (strain CBS 962.96) TaxID=1314807 RepID=A0A4S8MYF3_DENBC|nr:MAS20-domain-containing protein [Dendrothele bispora CBS 962.96]
MSSRASSILTIAGVTLLGLAAYAAYFDYKRRNDVDFRRKLRKEKKRVDKTIASSKAAEETTSTDDLRAALEQVKKEEVPVSPEQKEAYFMSQVAAGEQMSIQGPNFHLPAALAFYRALRVYPSPVELMVIYQKTVPEPIFKLVIELTNLDVKDRVEGYYDHFPPKSLGVAVETRKVESSNTAKKVLVVNKDFKAGEVIYKENPVVAALDYDLQNAGTHCSHCLRAVDPPTAVKTPQDPINAVYCSTECQSTAKTQSHALLFTLERPLPAEIPTEPITPVQLEARRKAQVQYVEHLKKVNKAAPLLVARFLARQIALEMNKLIPGAGEGKDKENDFVDADGGDYLLADHLERLRYLEIKADKEEIELITDVLQTVLPGLEQFVAEERYSVLLGKMAYNAFGVYFDGGREDKPASEIRPEDQEKTRTPVGTERQIGTALYTVSSYLSHSCDPSARPSFDNGTSELHLIATRDLKAGDELTCAFVDVTQHESESPVDARRRRRMNLARGWRFACSCDRCLEEAKTLDLGSTSEEKVKDESKVEASVAHYQENEGGDI